MENSLEKVNVINPELISNLVLNGDIGKMSDTMKVEYYKQLCHSLNLNPVTRPFQIISFQGKSVLYATKDATEQLRKLNGVSVVDLTQDIKDGLCITKCKVQDASGRYDIATGITVTAGTKGGDTANMIMKSETKAKRRATLSICGLGMLDESELDTMPTYKTSDISAVKQITAGFADKVIAYLSTCKTKAELESAYDIAKTRDNYINSSDKDKQDIDEAFVNATAKFITIEKFNPETEDTIPFDIPPAEEKKTKDITVFDLLPNELPEITKIKECKTQTSLNKYYKSITETAYYKQYADDYKKELQETYDVKMKELKSKN